MDNRRYLGGFAILALVLLRLATGWHFFNEGLSKIERDSTTGEFRMNFSAAGFLSGAKGPLADSFQAMAPNGHDWKTLLAVPHQNKVNTPEEAKAAANRVPYKAWAERIEQDWEAMLSEVRAVPNLTENQLGAAKAAFDTRKAELEDYLEGEGAAIAEYQHELWRLDQWRLKPEAADLPFEEERVAKKATDTAAKAKAWVAGVASLESQLVADLRGIDVPNPKTNITANALETATTTPGEASLHRVNLAATLLTLGVGICLLLGLFTRLAAVAGAVFLLSVIATQPPWLATAEPTIDQTVEMAGLLVLAGTGAGRWLGLDYFSWALFSKHDESPQTHVS